jgi:hypothetical protein
VDGATSYKFVVVVRMVQARGEPYACVVRLVLESKVVGVRFSKSMAFELHGKSQFVLPREGASTRYYD